MEFSAASRYATHQLAVYKQRGPRLRPVHPIHVLGLAGTPVARLARCPGVCVQLRTVIAWQRKRFHDHWRRLSQQGTPGRPATIRRTQLHDLAL